MTTTSRAHRSRRSLLGRLLAPRTRALLSLGLVLPMGFTGTLAAWTDSANLTGTSFTSGTLDVKLNGTVTPTNDNAVTATLSMTNAIPGATTAEVVTLYNNGNMAFKWGLTGGLNGTDASTVASASAMSLTIRSGGSKSGSGQTSTCTGGSVIFGPTALTSTTSTSLLTGQGGASGMAASSNVALCFQFTFAASADNSLQTKSFGATFTFTGTSDLT